NSSNETAFVVERSLMPDFSTLDATVMLDPNSTSFSDTTVRPQNEYFYRVTAMNEAGRSGLTKIRTVTPELPPTVVRAAAVSDSEIDLTWTINSSAQVNFRIERASP